MESSTVELIVIISISALGAWIIGLIIYFMYQRWYRRKMRRRQSGGPFEPVQWSPAPMEMIEPPEPPPMVMAIPQVQYQSVGQYYIPTNIKMQQPHPNYYATPITNVKHQVVDTRQSDGSPVDSNEKYQPGKSFGGKTGKSTVGTTNRDMLSSEDPVSGHSGGTADRSTGGPKANNPVGSLERYNKRIRSQESGKSDVIHDHQPSLASTWRREGNIPGHRHQDWGASTDSGSASVMSGQHPGYRDIRDGSAKSEYSSLLGSPTDTKKEFNYNRQS